MIKQFIIISTVSKAYQNISRRNCNELQQKVYRMGQRVKVRVLDADKEMRTIDFCIGE